MKRSGFTLIELIFVIVIIGVLSAVAIPKFTNLKQNAEAASVIKVANDAFSSVPSAYVNAVDLEETFDATNVKLDTLVGITGKGWVIDTTTQNAQTAIYTDSSAVATLTLDPSTRQVTLLIDCDGFSDSGSITKCKAKTDDDVTQTLTF
jgi:general secretion pathway protein G